MSDNKFWTGNANGVAEPKRNYKFLASFGLGPNLSIHNWLIKRVTKPSWTVSETSHQFLNWTFYYPGRVEWNTIDVTLVDPIDPSSSGILMNHLAESGWTKPTEWVPNQARGRSTVSKDRAMGALGLFEIEQMDSHGNMVESWHLKNPFITNVTFGDLAYDDEGLTEISMTLRYDWAEIRIGGPTSTTVDKLVAQSQ